MHSLSWLANNGAAAIVCFPGVMYRGGAEQKIRKYLIDNNFVDCIIQLPDNLFYGTSIATCIKATTDHWYNIAIGTSQACISVTLVNKDSYIGVELYIADNKALFDKLYEERNNIQKELGFELDWQRLDNSKASRILYKINGLNFDDHSNYDELIETAIDRVIKIREVFKNRLK